MICYNWNKSGFKSHAGIFQETDNSPKPFMDHLLGNFIIITHNVKNHAFRICFEDSCIHYDCVACRLTYPPEQ